MKSLLKQITLGLLFFGATSIFINDATYGWPILTFLRSRT